MHPPPQAVLIDGAGPDVVLLHGTGADRLAWTRLIPLMRDVCRCTAYDRRGCGQWPLAEGEREPTVGDHAGDAADVILSLGPPAYLCAASFGAVVALELMKRRSHLVAGAVLFEPALSGDERVPAVPPELLDQIERLASRGELARAAEVFYRRALGEAAWKALSEETRAGMRARGPSIRRDLAANSAHRVGYEELTRVDVPVLLLSGGRSRPAFEPGLAALQAALPCAERQVIANAEHVPRGEAWPEVAAAIRRFIGL